MTGKPHRTLLIACAAALALGSCAMSANTAAQISGNGAVAAPADQPTTAGVPRDQAADAERIDARPPTEVPDAGPRAAETDDAAAAEDPAGGSDVGAPDRQDELRLIVTLENMLPGQRADISVESSDGPVTWTLTGGRIPELTHATLGKDSFSLEAMPSAPIVDTSLAFFVVRPDSSIRVVTLRVNADPGVEVAFGVGETGEHALTPVTGFVDIDWP